MTLKERLCAIAAQEELSISAFEKRCGLGNAFVKSAGENVGASKLGRILREFPNISPLWLLTGIGDMLNNGENPTYQISGFPIVSDKEVQILREELNKKNEQIDRLIKLLEHIVFLPGKYDIPSTETSPKSRQK